MTASRAALITPDQLMVVVTDLWDATFSCPVTMIETGGDPTDASWAAIDIVDDTGVVAQVRAAASKQTLHDYAAAVFRVDEPDPTQKADVLTEAVNVVAGNVKGILRLQTRLGPPWVGEGPDRPADDRHTTTVRAGDEHGRTIAVHLIDHYSRRPDIPPVESGHQSHSQEASSC